MNDTRRTTSVNLSVQQTTHHLMSEALCRDLRDAVESGSLDGGGTGSIQCRACVVLYLLLCDHLVDQRGRCLSCRRPGVVLGRRRRPCRIHVKASFWLRQPDDVVLRHLPNELNHHPAPAPGTGGRPDRCHPTWAAPTCDPDATEVSPRIFADHGEPFTEPLQTPAVPSPLPPRGLRGAGRPDPAHGGTGDDPDGPRSRRAPSEDPSHSGQAGYVVLSERRIKVTLGAD